MPQPRVTAPAGEGRHGKREDVRLVIVPTEREETIEAAPLVAVPAPVAPVSSGQPAVGPDERRLDADCHVVGERPPETGLTEDEEDLVRALIRRGLAHGHLSTTEISLRRRFDDAHEEEDEDELQIRSGLILVMGELGVIVDDHPPGRRPWSDVAALEQGNAVLADDAMEFLSGRWAPETDPLYLYGKEIDRPSRLSRHEEAELGAEMERGRADALIALSQWPAGLRMLLSVADEIIAGSRALETVFEQQTTGGDESGIHEDGESTPDSSSGDGLMAVQDSVTTVADMIPVASALQQHLLALDGSAVAGSVPAPVADVVRGLRLSRECFESLLRLSHESDPPHPARSEFAEGLERTAAAWRAMTEMNLHLVVSFVDRDQRRALPVLDMIQEGNLGLMRAVEKFDYRRGFRLFTYASWWIRQTIARAVADKARVVRLPVHMLDRLDRVTRARDLLEGRLERIPEVAEIAVHVDLTPGQVERAFAAEAELEPLDVLHESGPLAPALRDPAESAEACLLRRAQQETIAAMLDTLKPREAHVIRLRFGLDSGSEHTLEEIGQKLGLTRERIRQIEAKALERLRHPTRARTLAAVWYGTPGM